MAYGNFSKICAAILIAVIVSVPSLAQSGRFRDGRAISLPARNNVQVVAQANPQRPANVQQVTQANPQTRPPLRTKSKRAKKAKVGSEPAVSVVERPTVTEFLSGEATVAIVGSKNPVIKLGLSPNGATIIEFPASDKLFNIIPGNSNLVTVEESETKESDRFIVVRPGDGFASPMIMAGVRRTAATSVIVQMTSGLVVTFVFYPVKQLIEQAHRVVLNYNRNEVVAARRATGLITDLDSPSIQNAPRTISTRIGKQQSSKHGTETTQDGGDSETINISDANFKRSSIDLNAATTLALDKSLKSSVTLRWSKEIHGLKIAAFPVQELDRNTQVVVVAVYNKDKSAVRLLPDNPEIYAETNNSKDRNVQNELVRKLAVKTNATDDIIPAESVRMYAIVYEAPILGARQQLTVSAAQRLAADEPATIALKDFAGPAAASLNIKNR